MLAHQRMVGSDGYEVALFPLEYLYMSQDENGDYSHMNTYNIDFLGWGANGRIYECPLYAPCTMKVVALWGYSSSHTVTFESVDKVHLPNGSLDYLTLSCTHANNPPYHTVGDTIQQGEICYYTGTTGNVTGDHVHLCVGQGHYSGYTQRTGGHYDLSNRIHCWEGLFVNDTVIRQGYGHPWIEYQGGSTPTERKQHKFPWVLYAKKLRYKSQFR